MCSYGAVQEKLGLRAQKSTHTLAKRTMEDVLGKLKERGLNEVDIFIKGIGSGRESAIRALQGSGLAILTIRSDAYSTWWG